MPVNKKESLVFSLMMCGFMVFFMSIYNVVRIYGTTDLWFQKAWMGFPIAFIVAFIADWYIVGPLAKKLAYRFIKHDDPIWKKVVLISTSMVTGMVLVMSLYGAILGVGLSSKTLVVWLMNIPFNFIVALPLQMGLAGPVVRLVFRSIFPIGTIVEV